MTNIINRINNIKEGTAIIISVNEPDTNHLLNIVLAKENGIIKAYGISE